MQSIEQIVIAEAVLQVGKNLERALLSSLRESLPQSENCSLVLSAKDQQGIVVGGVVATTSYGWLLVKVLWVAKTHRRQGLGHRLMHRVETKASEVGCRSAWLDTSNPSAQKFYASLGYEVFGRLDNAPGQHPGTHSRWFMKKEL